MPDHANRIQVSYTPLFGANKKISSEIANLLKPAQWLQLINHLSQLPEPVVPIAPSRYAIKVRARLDRRPGPITPSSASARSSSRGRSGRPTAATWSGTPTSPRAPTRPTCWYSRRSARPSVAHCFPACAETQHST